MIVQELINILENLDNKEMQVEVRYAPLYDGEEPRFSTYGVESVSVGISAGGSENYVYIDV